MSVNPEAFARHNPCRFGHDAFDLRRQRSSVGVAKDDPSSARVISRARAFECVGRIGLVAVKEVLAVDHCLATRRDSGAHAVPDAREVLLERAAERDVNVIIPRFGDEHDRVGVCGEQRGDAGIVGGRAAGALGHAEGAKARLSGRLALKKPGIDRIGAGIAALHIIDSKLVEQRPRSVAYPRAKSRRRSSVPHRAGSYRRDRGVRGSWCVFQWRVVDSDLASDFVIVVFAEPLIVDRREIAPLGDKSLALENRSGGVADVAGDALGAARLCELHKRVYQRAADPAARESGVYVEHVDNVGALEAREAGNDAFNCRDERQSLREP